jgi:DnaJ homolog subfamily C member 25
MLSIRFVYGVFLLLAMWTTFAGAEDAAKVDADATVTEPSNETSEESSSSEQKVPVVDKFDVHNEDWGTYYDPKNIFCGNFDCYKILGFDYESFGKNKPTTKEITKRYRRLSRIWHPDKSKHKNAKARFVKIARAYEVLTNFEERKEYDALRYDQEAYFKKYGSSVLWAYAPKTDVTIVVLLLFIIGNIVSWYSQKHRWQMVADRLIKAAVEDWTPKDGGTPESKQLREEALAILAAQEAAAAPAEDTNGTTAAATDSKSKKKKEAKKVPGREKKKMEQDALLPIVTELVNAMHDFGAGFHKPTYQDLLAVTMIKFPYHFGLAVVWQVGFWIRRFQKKELSDEERAVLTERAVGITWKVASEEDKQAMIKRELWIKENLLEWKEEQVIKNLSATEQKMYYKLKKKGMLDKLE